MNAERPNQVRRTAHQGEGRLVPLLIVGLAVLSAIVLFALDRQDPPAPQPNYRAADTPAAEQPALPRN